MPNLPHHKPESLKNSSNISSFRNLGLMKQAESLANLAIQIFADLAQSISSIGKRTADLHQRSLIAEEQTMKLKATSVWHSPKTEISVEEPLTVKEVFKPSRIVKSLLSNTKPAQPLDRFDYIVHDGTNFNKYYSDPEYLRRQYIQELMNQNITENEKRLKGIRQEKKAEPVVAAEKIDYHPQSEKSFWKPPSHLFMPPPPKGLSQLSPSPSQLLSPSLRSSILVDIHPPIPSETIITATPSTSSCAAQPIDGAASGEAPSRSLIPRGDRKGCQAEATVATEGSNCEEAD
jgi:hypothetical protein